SVWRTVLGIGLLSALALPIGSTACVTEELEAAPTPVKPPGEAPPAKDSKGGVAKLGRTSQFLIGHCNDLPGAEKNFDFAQAAIYSLPAKLDIHYVYLTGLAGEQGWPDDNDGNFVSVIANIDASKNVTPMFTLYQMASRDDGDLSGLEETDFMTKYWSGVRRMFDQLGKL